MKISGYTVHVRIYLWVVWVNTSFEQVYVCVGVYYMWTLLLLVHATCVGLNQQLNHSIVMWLEHSLLHTCIVYIASFPDTPDFSVLHADIEKSGVPGDEAIVYMCMRIYCGCASGSVCLIKESTCTCILISGICTALTTVPCEWSSATFSIAY